MIRVVAVQPLAGAGNLKAFADVQIDGLTVKGFRVIQQSGQRAWVSVPQQQAKDGRYFNIVEFADKAELDLVRQAVLAAFESGPPRNPRNPYRPASWTP